MYLQVTSLYLLFTFFCLINKLTSPFFFCLQGAAIWHPRCGPGPGQNTNGNITLYLNGPEDKDDRFSSSAASEFQVLSLDFIQFFFKL